jgi:hypothetical protein
MFAAAVMGAMAFTREREGHTWEALRLSLLTPGQIIQGKAGAIVLSCLIYALPLALLGLVWATRYAVLSGQAYSEFGGSQEVVSVAVASRLVALLAIGVAAIWCSAACGMLLSWFHRTTPAAIGWTIVTLAVSSVVALYGPEAAYKMVPVSVTQSAMHLIHPTAALSDFLQAGDWARPVQSWHVDHEYLPPPTYTLLPSDVTQTIKFVSVSALTGLTIFLVGQLLLGVIRFDMKRRIDREPQAR